MLTHWLGIDTGGTFTDFVYFDGRSLRTYKVLSTPHAPELAILQGIEALQLSAESGAENLKIIHGSTVATNALLEGQGVKTVYVTNRGFADVLSIGRQARSELYNLMPAPCPPLIPSEHCLEINTRLSAQGELLAPLQQADIDALVRSIIKIKPCAVAINLLFSFLDDAQEQMIKESIRAAYQQKDEPLFISCSSEVLPEHKEYERGLATALNAYVGPLMQGYLTRLSACLTCGSATEPQRINLSVMQSSGGSIDAKSAGEHAVKLLLSGPAGGLKGAQYIAELTGESKLLSFDMGGTSTDVAMMDGKIRLTSEGRIGGYPVAVPMVDMHTIGAGGGSIASVDGGGLLNVGPQSAGASPGPACYGQGGKKPTVTDANLILGRLRAEGFSASGDKHEGSLHPGLRLDIDAAKRAVQTVAEPLGVPVEAAAQGILRIANEHMVRALRQISVQRGYDPQTFSLTCLGGAAGLHVCALADALKMHRAIVPVHGGVLSALGMLVAAPSRELSRTRIQALQDCDPVQLDEQFAQLQAHAVSDMKDELKKPPVVSRSVDLRYKGQSFTLNLDWAEDVQSLQQAFHRLHEKTWGHRLEMPVELVNLRISVKGEAPAFALPLLSDESSGKSVSYAEKQVDCYVLNTDEQSRRVRVYQREQLVRGEKISGPALVPEKVSTTLIEPAWRCEVDDWGNLLLFREGYE